jgi:hypothetical protein
MRISTRTPLSRLQMLLFVLGLFILSCSGYAQNAITAENALPGTAATVWDVNGAGDLSIQGFGTEMSVNKGQTIHFKINTDASAYTIRIYRLGYYQGNGARLMGTGTITASLPQVQPAELYDPTTGLTDCGNWTESAHWDVPANAVSGMYIAKLTRTDNGGASHMVFIVRDDASHSDVFFKASDATWQAYNVYGGNSLYVGSTSYAGGHATKVSYNRPFITRNGGGGGGAAQDWLFNAEYPMIRWMEANGYDMTYTTDIDADRSGSLLLNHKAILSVGHDEYWSGQERTNWEAARAAGVHLAFFSGNEIYWKTRWENSTDGTNTPNRTLVCYKEGTLGENICGDKCDPLPNVWTGLWRDGGAYPAADGNRPENALSGQISWDGTTGAIEVPDTYKNLRFWRNTSIASLGAGQTATLSDGTLGYEWDWEQYPASYPANRILLSGTVLNTHTHHLSLYRYSSGALVFGAGTVQWSWGLDGNHDNGSSVPDVRMQQATINLFADMGIQPASIQSGLIAATASSDVQTPTSVITSPAPAALLPNGGHVIVTGTASDNIMVAGVEVSVDGGTTWLAATGTTSWSFTWTPTTQGLITIKSRAFDDSGNIETEGSAPAVNAIIDTVSAPLPVVCPCTIFQPIDAPAVPLANDQRGIEVGMKFRATEDGYITGIRYYKGSGTTGLHIGDLWSTTGTLLAQATFTAETASGWQEVTLGTPVAITAGNTYIVSYYSTSGDYPYTSPGLTTSVVNGPVQALADGVDGPNGVYNYNDEPIFPTQSYQASNYWADVVFNTYVGPDTTSPTVISVSPAVGASAVDIASNVHAIFNEAIDPATLSSLTFELYDGSNTLVPSTISYNSIAHEALLDPSSPLAYSTTYRAVVKGGTGYQRVKDIGGNPLLADYSWTFTTGAVPPPPPNEGPGGPILLISAATNPFSRFPVEILRAEGYNEFTAMDITQVNATVLNAYDVVIVGNIPLSAAEVTMLSNWTNAGGTLIALRPDAQLSTLLGLTPASGTLDDKYLLVNTAAGAGVGIANQTMQYHSQADLYTLSGATSLATLYSNANTATTYPAVTSHAVGTNGGQAFAFTYDLARSIVYTRQGNPLWAGQKRDGQIDPIRSDDMFFPDWIDFNKVAIPQADEQQHLLSNIILKSNLHKKPLPKFWFLPKGLKAAIVQTGDDHGDAGMQPRFDIDIASSTPGCSVANWDCIRSTGYLYVGSTFNDSMAKHYNDLGFEVALHVLTDCGNYNQTQLQNFITNQFSVFNAVFPSIPTPTTNRTHCIAWSDFSMPAEVEAANGIRLDVNYYYWPATWIQDRPGMFTGSGMPMRFAKADGTIIDCYQAATQMPDESGETFPAFCDALLDKAQGPEGYYGVFTTNMHFDNPNHPGANAIVASAQAHGVPVVTAKQMLDWLDGRNGSSFGAMSWSGNALSFTVAQGVNARNLKGMVPFYAASGQLTGITFNGSAATFSTQTIKGIVYAFFDANGGNYIATYSTADTTAPVISNIVATPHSDGTATITWTTNEASTSSVDYAASPNALTSNSADANLLTSHSIVLTGLSQGVTYHFRVTSADVYTNSATSPVPDDSLSFTMPTGPCITDQTVVNFNLGTVDANTSVVSDGDGAVILKPSLLEDFSGVSTPSAWTDAIWDGQAGAVTTYSGGQVAVNGTHLSTNSTFAPGTSVEFTATFTAGNFQNVGFTADPAFNAPWIVIGRGNVGDNNVYARSSDLNTSLLGTNLLGTAHKYRIEWTITGSYLFYVDDVLISTPGITQTVTSNMNVQISDYPAGGVSLNVDWIRISPYASSGSFTSQVFDGGAAKNWGGASWNAAVPANTTLSVFTREGNTSTPDGTWTPYTQVASSGANVGGTSQYIQYRIDLTSSNNAATPAFKDISIDCSSSGSDITAPIITNIVATPHSDGTATITWTTNEGSNSAVNYGASLLVNNINDLTIVVSHSITLTGLIQGTTYFFRVTSADTSGNSATSPIPNDSLSFTMPVVPCVIDQSTADFSQGTIDSNVAVVSDGDGAIALKLALNEDFSVTSAPQGWTDAIWDGQAGAVTTYSGGQVSVDGTHLATNATFGPGSTVEYMATYSAGNFQNVGFTADAAFDIPWVVIGRAGLGDNNIYARSSDGSSSLIGTNLLGTPHKYRIEWSVSGSFLFYVDDVLIATPGITMTVSSAMNVQISDYPSGGVSLSVDWIRVMPYATPGTFESKVFDAASLKNWGNISWTSQTPSGTALSISVREGNTPIPDTSWTNYALIASSGTNVGGTSRYIQYKADLSTSNSSLTPVLNDISINCSSSSNQAPLVTVQPSPQTVCIGPAVVFVSKATGSPTPAAQWQVSIDNGGSWNDVNGVVADTLRFVPAASDNNKQYRCVWTNSEGSANSNAATLLVNPLPSATISAVNASICQGDSIRLQLISTGANQPYNIVVNGVGYTGVQAGQVIALSGAIEKSIWGNTGSPANPAVTDNQPIEVGVKFQSAVSGYIRGVRFYKGTANTGTHVGSLWTTGGTQLATATFTNESASGWQEVYFSAPVAIQANTTYIASYFSQGGYFAISSGFFSGTAVTNAPLTALQSGGPDGVNGVYRYGGGFPNGGNTANYWVDVLFESTYTTPQTFNYSLTSVSDTNGCSATGSPLSSTSVVINPMPMGVISAPANACAGDSIQLTYNASSGVGPYTLTINGATYSNISSGVPFNSGSLPATGTASASVWDNTVIGGEPTVIDSDDIELGMKFRSNISGQITGARFYKRLTNTGAHIGSLWSSTGVQLATATYTNETASGWQQVNFSSPVNITANTTYVISYHAPKGNYAFDSHFFSSAGVTNGPLTALQSGVDGSNGVFQYGSGAIFPNLSFNDANYWVDVVFSSVGSNNFTLTNIADATGCASSGSPISSVTTSTANPAASSTAASICQGSSYSFNGISYSASGTFAATLTGVNGCDSIATLNLTVKPTSSSTTTASICQGSSYLFNGVSHNATGSYPATLTGVNGCDSIATLNLTVKPTSSSTTTASICQGSSYSFNGTSYSASGTFTATLTGVNGCDSIATLNLTVKPTSSSTTTASICQSSSYSFNGTSYSASGTFAATLTGGNGCDSIATLNLTVKPTSSSTTTASICQGSSYSFNGTSYSASGTFAATLTGVNGCDSIATLNLTVKPTSSSTTTASICQGSSYSFNGTSYSATGTVTATLTGVNGCDSIATLNLTVKPTSSSTTTASICQGSSYSFNGTSYSASGTFTATLTGVNGCDSIATLNLTVKPTSSSTTTASICQGSSYSFNGTSYSATGTVTATLTGVNGCDSIATLNLTVKPTSSSTTTASICQGSSYLFNGVSHNATGSYPATLTGVNGCDSIATLNLTVLPTGISTIAYQTSCNPADTGVLVLHFNNTYGCDSMHTIITSLLPVSSTTVYQTSCNPADTGVVVLHFANIYGCDSAHTIVTTLLPASAPTITYRASCNPADTGVVALHFNNIYGCDSVHETITTLLSTSATTAYLMSCNPADTGVIVAHYSNINGCDSVHTRITTLLPASAPTITYRASCNPADTGVVALHFNNIYGCDSVHEMITTLLSTSATTAYLMSCNPSDTGVIVAHYSNINGCDSVHTTITTLLPASAPTITYRTSCSPLDTGIVIRHFTNIFGCDSIHEVVTSLLPASMLTTYRTSCNPADTGTIVLHFTSSYGCDSIHKTITSLLPSSSTTIYQTSCNPADTGVVVLHFNNAYGCDSIETIITILSSTPVFITQYNDTLFVSSGGSYQWYLNNTLLNGKIDSFLVVTQNGTYEVKVTNSNGCQHSDTIVVTNVGVLDITGDWDIKLYPNPNKGVFTLDCNYSLYAEAKITDALGRYVMDLDIKGNRTEVNASSLADGVYFLNVNNGGQYKAIRFIVAR